MGISLANMRLHARILYQDTSTASPALTDAQLASLINEKYAWYKEEVDPRTLWVNHTDLFGAATAISSAKATTSATNYRKVLALMVASDATALDLAAPLERVEMNELGDYGTAATYALSRQQLTSTAADNGKWTVYFGAAPSSVRYTAFVIKEVTALSADADVPELSDHESYMVARMAATDAARLSGRNEMVQEIMAPLPQGIRDAMTTAMAAKKPRQRTTEDAF